MNMASVFDFFISFLVWTTNPNFPSVCMHIFDPLIASSLDPKGNAPSSMKSKMKMDVVRLSFGRILCLGLMCSFEMLIVGILILCSLNCLPISIAAS